MPLSLRPSWRTAWGGWGLLAIALGLGACAEALPLLEAVARPDGRPGPADGPSAGGGPNLGGSPTPSRSPAAPASPQGPSSPGLAWPAASPAPRASAVPTAPPEGADWPVASEGGDEVFGSGRLSWQVRKQGDRYGLWLSSDLHTELTVKLALTLENLSEGPSEPLLVVPARSEGAPVLASSWAVKDPSQPHRYDFSYRFRLGDFRVKPDPKSVYALPLPAGMTVRLQQGWNGAFSHQGDQAYAVDLPFPEGTVVRASRAGVVVGVNAAATTGGVDEALKAAEKTNFVRVRHEDGSLASYLHLQHQGVLVALGERVALGQALGRSGNTGYSSAPHLHFEVHSPADAERSQSHPFLWQHLPPPAAPVAPEEGQRYTGF